MSKSMKAVLLSAFVFPGAGHFFFKKNIVGSILAGATIVSLYSVISNVLERALQIAEKIQLGEVNLDVAVIAELVSKQPVGPEVQQFNIASIILLIVWLIGIIDSYRVGNTLSEH
jgi:hypothetical protein